jgi:hypothetical protein
VPDYALVKRDPDDYYGNTNLRCDVMLEPKPSDLQRSELGGMRDEDGLHLGLDTGLIGMNGGAV